ncbi:DUF531 family protein [Archaeoglobus neptunius]|uniref:DUF531 family protein n=1 Tax=Archaeoglobus neptunius TaxID=2798580 RepID=UPI001925414A|nr:DUF531 family protein [Archaeoglobus neptunius]
MIVICLVNTYDKLKKHEIHLRSIARAAPLCYAFNMHLALLDFPFWKKPEEVAEEVAEYTTIGNGGKYLLGLAEEGKLHLVEKIPAHFGVSIATTSKPDPKKNMDLELLKSLNSATFLIGLGRKGLPSNILKSARYHLDITQQGVSLETCTAIGAIAMLLALRVVKRWRK